MSRALAANRSLRGSGWRSVGVWLVALWCALVQVSAAEVDLTWTPSISPEVTGYRIYCTETDTGEAWTVDVGATTGFTLGELTGGRAYRLHVCSYDAEGRESGPSNAVELIAPTVDGVQSTIHRSGDYLQLRWSTVAGVTYQIWTCTDLGRSDWVLVHQILAGSSSLYWEDRTLSHAAERYYRVTPVD